MKASARPRFIRYLILAAAVSLLPAAGPAFAKTITIQKEYSLHTSEDDSKSLSKTVALRHVSRLLIDELGSYLENETDIKKLQLTKDLITGLAVPVVNVDVLEEKWDGNKYYIKAKIDVDTEGAATFIKSLSNDRQKALALENNKKRSGEFLKKADKILADLNTASGEAKVRKLKEYYEAVKGLRVSEWFEKGIKSALSRDFRGAIEHYGKAIALDPAYAAPFINRGDAYAAFGDLNKALADLNKAIDLDIKSADAYFVRGTSYARAGVREQAMKDFDKAIELDPQYTPAYYNRGSLFIQTGDYQKAMNDFDKSIELNPRDAEAYGRRGAGFVRFSDPKRAVQDLDRAIELNPKSAPAYASRGDAYRRFKEYKKAVMDYDRAIELDPNEGAVYNNRGITHNQLHEFEASIKDFDRAIELDPKNAVAYFNRGNTYFLMRNVSQGIEDIKRAARLGLIVAQDFLRVQNIYW